jgi:hypothetical protein
MPKNPISSINEFTIGSIPFNNTNLISISGKVASGKGLVVNSIMMRYLEQGIGVLYISDTRLKINWTNINFETTPFLYHILIHTLTDFHDLVDLYNRIKIKNNIIKLVLIIDVDYILETFYVDLSNDNDAQTRHILYEKYKPKHIKIELDLGIRNRLKRDFYNKLYNFSSKENTHVIITSQSNNTPNNYGGHNMSLLQMTSLALNIHRENNIFQLSTIKSRYSLDNQIINCNLNPQLLTLETD